MGVDGHKISKTGNLLSSIRCSVKQWDLFDDGRSVLEVKCKLTSFDVETRCLSTFQMILKCCAARHVFGALASREIQPENYMRSRSDGRVKGMICSFLEGCASALENNPVNRMQLSALVLESLRKWDYCDHMYCGAMNTFSEQLKLCDLMNARNMCHQSINPQQSFLQLKLHVSERKYSLTLPLFGHYWRYDILKGLVRRTIHQ